MNNNSKNRGDRIVQIILLVLIAAGIATFPLMMGNSSGGSAGGPPGMGAPGGMAGMNASGEGETEGTAVEVSPVVKDTVREYIKVNGDVTSASSVSIYPDMAGKLVSVNVSLGDEVKRGETVAMVDPSQPGQVYSNSAVKATIGGTITEVSYDEGETVSTGSAIVTIGDLDELEIVTYIPERYVSSVRKGLTAEVSFDSYEGEVFQARVTEISPVLDTDSRSQEISLALIGADSRVKVGMFASVKLVVKEEADVITIPKLALTTYYDEDVVYVVEDGKAVRRSVQIGLSSSETVQITEGLEEGETVVVRGISNLSDGTLVSVVE